MIKKSLRIVLDIFVLIVVLVALGLLLITLISKKDTDGAANVFGYQIRTIISDSMDQSLETNVETYNIKSLPIKSLIIIQMVPEEESGEKRFFDSIEVGDVLTFKYVYVSQETITHRVISKEKDTNNGWIIKLSGDNKVSENNTGIQTIYTNDSSSSNYIIGKVIYANLFFGIIINGIKEPLGLILLIIIPSLIIAIIQIIKIVSIIKVKKNKDSTTHEKDKEIEALKKEIELIKQEIKK